MEPEFVKRLPEANRKSGPVYVERELFRRFTRSVRAAIKPLRRDAARAMQLDF